MYYLLLFIICVPYNIRTCREANLVNFTIIYHSSSFFIVNHYYFLLFIIIFHLLLFSLFTIIYYVHSHDARTRREMNLINFIVIHYYFVLFIIMYYNLLLFIFIFHYLLLLVICAFAWPTDTPWDKFSEFFYYSLFFIIIHYYLLLFVIIYYYFILFIIIYYVSQLWELAKKCKFVGIFNFWVLLPVNRAIYKKVIGPMDSPENIDAISFQIFGII